MLALLNLTGRPGASPPVVSLSPGSGKVGAGDDRTDTIQGFGAAGVDADDAGMGVRATQHLAV